MNVKDLIAALEMCSPHADVSIYVPDLDDPDSGFQYAHEILEVERGWDDKSCTGKPNMIGIVATERLAKLETPNSY